MTPALTELLALRAYLDAVAANGRTREALALLNAVHPDDATRLVNYDDALEADATRNAGLLADIVDAAYGKGAAERLGYPRGLLTRVRRVFVVARRVAWDRYIDGGDVRELQDYTRRTP